LSERILENRRRGHIDDFSLFQIDYDTVFNAFRAETGALPAIVCGHSMGGLATARFLSRRQSEVSGGILSAPMLGLAMNPLAGWAVRTVSRAMTAFGYGEKYVYSCDDRSSGERGFEGNVLTSDPARYAIHAGNLRDNPELALGGSTHGWLVAAYREMASVAALPPGWLNVPSLVLEAEMDTVVSNAAIARFAARNPQADRAIINGSRHEPLMEVEAVQTAVWPVIDGYLDKVFGAEAL